MNNKITFPKLASLLADKSGRSKRFSEDFLRELFAIISEQLEAGESVKVKGLGTFRLMRVEPRKSVDVTTGLPMEIAGHSKVVFTPAKELAEAINAPFEAFSPVEIGDDVDLDKISEDADVEVSDDSEEIMLSAVEQNSQDEPVLAESLEEEVAPEETIIDDKDEAENELVEVDQDQEEQLLEDESLPINNNGKAGWIRALLISVACAVIAVVATFLIWSVMTKPDSKNLISKDSGNVTGFEETQQQSDLHDINIDKNSLGIKDINADTKDNMGVRPEDDVPTTPSDALVYDTIGRSRYLTTMAKDHYGNNKFWPYIYEENKSHIGHPDKIRPGTPIVIPSLSKYGVDPSNPDDEAKANKLGAEIYARYGKSI